MWASNASHMPAAPPSTHDLDTVPPPRWRQLAFRLRYVLLSLYFSALAALVIGFLIETADEGGEPWLAAMITLLIFFGAQALFLVGMPQCRWPKPTRGASMIVSIAVGAAVAGLLTFGVLATVLNLFNLWDKVTDAHEVKILWAIAVAWGGWFFVFLVMWAGEWLIVFRRIYKFLIAGTVLELLVTIPVDVHVRRRTSCWCGEGTFFALVIGGAVALWSFGPGLVLLFLTRRLQRRGYFSICRKCAYDLRGLQQETKHCPECGTRIPEKYRASLSGPKHEDGR
jgi:hypothetical protein